MKVEQKINWNLAGTRWDLLASLMSTLAVGCNREYRLDGEVRDYPNDPNQTGRFFITLHQGLNKPEIGRYRLIIDHGALTKEKVSHTFSIRTEPLLDLITVVLVPTGGMPNLKTVRLITELGVVQNSLPKDSRIHTLYNVDPRTEHTFEAYWSNLKFTRLSWNGELLKVPEPTPIDRSLA